MSWCIVISNPSPSIPNPLPVILSGAKNLVLLDQDKLREKSEIVISNEREKSYKISQSLRFLEMTL
jgi:hypothetical protein